MPATLLNELTDALYDGILKRWYPLVIDRECGGYYTNIRADWSLPPEQEKMIVTQARHVWTASHVARFTGEPETYIPVAMHGFAFLRDVMWDARFGGFYQIRGREGGTTDVRGWRDEKRAYGNAFAIFALAALYASTGDAGVLDAARRAFEWIEEHAHDPVHGGYFEFLTREGSPFDHGSAYRTAACDASELGYKDQNSSIHLLEAYTELYRVWPDPLVRERLRELLLLIRDVMVDPRGYLRLFFEPDWTPVSFRDSPEEVRAAGEGLDHVSFGHDYETAFLLLEASDALGLENDEKTLRVAKRMLDHSLAWGWEKGVGGFFDAGYYFRGEERCTITRATKNWWAQAEALNALLLFARIYPHAPYLSCFLKQWEYVKRYVLDRDHGDWFEGGIDREPEFRTGPKSHVWKCTYHTTRALMNCIGHFRAPGGAEPDGRTAEIAEFAARWRLVAGRGALSPA